MSFSNIDVTVRPIKIAFLVNYNDKANLQKAITINSVLWGGRYNSIIPVYNRVPSKYGGISGYMFLTWEDILEGYLDGFDPDYVVNLSSVADDKLPINKHRLIKETDIFDASVIRKKARGRGEVNYGTGVFEVLDYLVDKEFKYERKVPLPVRDIQFSKRYGMFFGGVFGEYSESVRESYLKRYKDTIGIKTEQITLANYFDVLIRRESTVQDLCNSYFDVFNEAGPHRDYLFLLDINSWQDIVDYINLLASGLNVLAVPIQLSNDLKAIDVSKKFIEENYKKYNQNQVFYSTTILKSRDCAEDEFKVFCENVHIPPPEPSKFLVSQQNWFPRMWDNWARKRDGGFGAHLVHRDASHEISGTSEIKVPALKPDFIDDSFVWWKPKYANEISIRSYGEDDFTANVFPTNIDRADRVLGRFDPDEWRFSKRGIVYFSNHGRGQISFKLPSADDVFAAWQDSLGVQASTSNPGKLARQIVKKLGVGHLDLLAFEDFAQMLKSLTNAKGTVQSISYEDMWAKIQKFTNGTIWYDADGFFSWILHTGIFELGTNVLCDNCNRESWHPLNGLETKLTCSICLENVELGLTEPKKQIKWAYRPIGPFSVPDLAQGAYTVVLTLNFFTEVMNRKITPRYSFESKDGDYEADFGALLSGDWQDGESIVQLLGECKSFGKKGKSQFKDSEVTKLVKLAQKSNNSVLVFATLSRDLSDPDKRKLKKLVLKIREAKFKGRQSVDVLVLTGNELFTPRSLKDSWEKLGDEYKPFVDKSDRYNIRELCDITQQIYLGTESYWDYFDRKRKARP